MTIQEEFTKKIIDKSHIISYNLIYMKNTFDLRLENISQDIWIKITQIEVIKGKWDGSAKLSPQILGRLKQSVLVTSIWVILIQIS